MTVTPPGAGGSDGYQTLFGVPSTAPPPPSAPPLLNAPPTVSSTPNPGQGVALDAAGRLGVAASRLVVLAADPVGAPVGMFWYRSDLSQLSVQHDASTIKRVTLS